MAITAKELARLLGLSETAISLALNNKPGVSTETRRMVIEQATRYGYDFSRIRGKQHQTGRISLLLGPYCSMSKGENNVFEEVVAGIRETSSKLGYAYNTLQLTPDQFAADGLEPLVMDLRHHDVDGMILVGADIPKTAVEDLLSVGVPIVLVDAFYQDLPCSAVTVNNRLGGRLAGDHLCTRFLSEPGYLRCRYRTEMFDERILGFMESVRYNAFSRHKVRVHTLSPSIADACADMLMLLDEGYDVPRALFAETDQLAIGAAHALMERGYRIPEDVAIMGFDNMARSRGFEVPLTTIDYPKALMGIEATKRLVDLVKNPSPYTTRIEVTPSLVRRASA